MSQQERIQAVIDEMKTWTFGDDPTPDDEWEIMAHRLLKIADAYDPVRRAIVRAVDDVVGCVGWKRP